MASRDLTVEYLTSTKIGEKGQLTVPKDFREDLGLATGAPFTVLRLGVGLILLPEQHRFEDLCKKLGAALAGASTEDVLATLPETRKRIYAKHYGKAESPRTRMRRSPRISIPSLARRKK